MMQGAISLLIACSIFSLCLCDLSSRLKHYEIVHNIDVHSISRRSTSSVPDRELHLSVFGKNFTLDLRPARGLFGKGFRIQVVHGDSTTEDVQGFDQTSFLTGRVRGDRLSRATVHINSDSSVTGVFTADGEEIALEPAKDHLDDPDFQQASTMVAYRRSDIIADTKNPPLCGSVHPDSPEQFEEVNFQSFVEGDVPKKRRKRDVSGERTCSLFAVADYKLFQDKGESDIFKTANYIANLVNRANSIFQITQFAQGGGYGFEFGMMRIHDAPSTGSDAEAYYYNIDKTDWGTTQFLEAFSRMSIYGGSDPQTAGDFCLAHLFTSQRFEQFVLGLAYIAASDSGSLGGICSGAGTRNGVSLKYNTGWSTYRNPYNSPVLFSQASLVTTHEMGHNFGSEHDPDNDRCSPDSLIFDDGGKFLMYTYSVDGSESNNDIFSPCSVDSVSAVITSKAAGCLQASSADDPCGNARIDDGEECDGGFLGSVGLDPCCSRECLLNAPAVCSPVNKACCEECQLASSTYQCRSEVEGLCFQSTNCNGFSLDCPTAQDKPENSTCNAGGSCRSGECIPFCEARGLTSCACGSVADSCKRCCRSGTDGPCTVQSPVVAVTDGQSCVQGYCNNGVCEKVDADIIQRVWDLIDSISFDLIVEAFRTNMVGCVIGFSLVVYIPICIIIWCLDRRRKKSWIKENSFAVRKDRGLDKDEDKRPVAGTGKPEASKPPSSRADSGEYLEPVSRRPGSRNQILPLGGHPTAASEA